MGIEDIKAGAAYVEIGTKDSDLVAGLNRAATRLRQFGSAVRGIGLEIAGPAAAIFGALTAAAKSYADQGSQLALGAAKTGVAVEALSTLGYAAKQSGVDMDSLEGALGKMGRTLTQAAAGSKEANGALAAVGLTVGELNGLSPDERFKRIADALNTISDPSVRAADAMAIFGKSGANLLPLLTQGAAGIDAMQAHARALGLQWSGADAAAAKQFSNTLQDLSDVAGRLADRFGAAVAPVLSIIAKGLISGAQAVGDFVDKHRELIATVAAASAGLIVFGGGIVAIGTAISVVGGAIGSIGSLLGIVVTAFGPIIGIVGTGISLITGLIGTAASAILPAIGAIASIGAPVLLVGAAVLGLGGYFLYTSGLAGEAFTAIKAFGERAFTGLSATFKSIVGTLKAGWAVLKTDALAAFGGIKDALGSGDWATAAKILWTTIRLEFDRGLQNIWTPMLTGFYVVKSALTDAWSDTVEALQDAWSYAKEYLTSWDGIKTAAGKFFDWIVNAWDSTIDYIASKWATQMVAKQADVDVRAKYEGKTIGEGDVKQIAADQLTPDRTNAIEAQSDKAVAAANPGLTGDALEDKQVAARTEAMAAETKRLEDEARKRFAGRKLTEQEITDFVTAETQRRAASQAQIEDAGRKQRQADYDAKQKALDDKFKASQPDSAAAGEAARAKIEADRAKQRLDNEKRLAAAIAAIDPSRQGEIDRLEKELADLIAQAKAEKDKKSGDPSKAAPSDDDDGNKPNLHEAGKSAAAKIPGIFQGFSASTVGEIFGNSQSDAANQTAKNTAKIATLMLRMVTQRPVMQGLRTT